MDSHCVLCGAEIKNVEQYQRNKASLIPKIRYQDILAVLLDSPKPYYFVFFDHQDELPDPYRERALRNESELRVQSGKSAPHNKEADITAVRGKLCDIVIEEERRPKSDHVQRDIDLITPCKYLWARGQEFELQNVYLFIVINDNAKHVSERNQKGKGSFRRVIVCTTDDFKQLYESYYLQGQ